MNVEMIRMSSKGQIVIPQDIRQYVSAGEGTAFAVIGSKDTIVLKKIEMPSKESLIKELKTMAEEGSRRMKKLGIKEENVNSIIHKRRLKQQ